MSKYIYDWNDYWDCYANSDKTYMSYDHESILIRALKPDTVTTLFKTNPELFVFSERDNWEEPVDDGVDICELYGLDFHKLKKHIRLKLLMNYSGKYIEKVDISKLSVGDKETIAYAAPDMFKKYSIPMNKKMSFTVWDRLMHKGRYKSYYKKMFVQNFGKLSVTDALALCRSYIPIADLTVDVCQNSGIPAKRWLYFIVENKNRNTILPEVKEYLLRELSVELMSGKSKHTKQLSTALGELKNV